jgi:hypothetical protein
MAFTKEDINYGNARWIFLNISKIKILQISMYWKLAAGMDF